MFVERVRALTVSLVKRIPFFSPGLALPMVIEVDIGPNDDSNGAFF